MSDTSNVPATRQAGSTAMRDMSPEERKKAILAKVEALKKTGAVPQAARGSQLFAKFDGNTGAWTIGKNREAIPDTQKFVIALEGAQRGYQFWKSGKVHESRMREVIDGPMPAEPDKAPDGSPAYFVGDRPKPEERDGWQETRVLQLTGKGGEYDGIFSEWSTTSYGGKQAADDAMNRMAHATATEQGREGFFNPVVTLGTDDGYEHKTYRRMVYNPIITVLGWTDGKTVVTDLGEYHGDPMVEGPEANDNDPLAGEDDHDPFG